MKRQYLILIVLAILTLACMEATTALPTPAKVAPTLTKSVKTVLASPSPMPTGTKNVVCLTLRGAVTVRNEDGRAVGWLEAGAPVCVVPGVKHGRLQLADGTANTILAACVYGPQKDCK